ncbi:SIMPL domain-containing protein [Aequorivita sinensis]|uniref:SIMPL domain-containing protein n=1 Tax=Aequorivita sinensis TaxID=1382458 RepID=UPI0023000B3D|nr:SIMPL domain-containing protein [Aequorivita sinensis]
MKTLQTILILALTTTAAMAQNTLPPPTIDVTGEGIVRVVPDEVTINIRVENTGENVKSLKKQNDAIVNDVIKFLKKMNIENKDVQTQYMNLNKNYDYNTKTYTFAANQAISIKLYDLSQYEAIISGLLDTGVNRIDGVMFSSSKKEALESQARKNAIENALMKAKEYAGVLNQTVGKAVSISEQTNAGPGPIMYKSAMMSDQSGGGQETIAPGEMEIKTSVNVSFLLN